VRFGSASRVLLKCVAAFACFMVLGNVAVYVMSAWARNSTPEAAAPDVQGVKNFQVVDDHLWRGAAPTPEGYRALVDQGASTIIDLRAEEGIEEDIAVAKRLGIDVVRIPMRDGQTPTPEAVARFLEVVQSSPGKVFVHCGAGVGRTGTMVGSYLVTSGEARPSQAVRRNLAVGPPSLEQIAFVAGLGDGPDRPNPAITAISRTLDAPRRIWSRL
jgi:protein-tyrosine phosphatase